MGFDDILAKHLQRMREMAIQELRNAARNLEAFKKLTPVNLDDGVAYACAVPLTSGDRSQLDAQNTQAAAQRGEMPRASLAMPEARSWLRSTRIQTIGS